MSERTSLERSHSKWSNFVLTLLSLLAAISFVGIFALLAFYHEFDLAKYFLYGDLALFVILLIAFYSFKR